MRRFHAFLLATGLVAAPMSAVAKPSDPPGPTMLERAEPSAGKRRLGVMLMTLSPELRTFFGSTDKTGVLVARVEPGSPAAMAGIAVGDVIVDVHGTKVDDAADVVGALAMTAKDQRVAVTVLRERKPMTLDVKLEPPATSILETWPGLRWLRDMFDVPERAKST
jgi:predicted metalloprotease with PDZ domain